MRRLSLLVLAVQLGAACSAPVCGGAGQPVCVGMMPDPPRVFLTAAETNQIGTTLKVKVTVSGCVKITQLQLTNAKQFLLAIDNPAKASVDLELPPALFNALYQSLGIAAQLTLQAKCVCDDGRSASSTTLGLSYFPVQAVTEPTSGNSTAMPDVFVAEGGVAGSPTTFVGCVGTQSGTALARFDSTGAAIKINNSLPFSCSYNSVITEKNKPSGFRWLIEPGVGVFSFDSSGPGSATDLDIRAYKLGTFVQLGIGPDGDAIVWDSRNPSGNNLFRLSKNPPGGAGANELPTWGSQATGIMAATPVVSLGEIYLVMWQSNLGDIAGTMMVQKFNYLTGTFVVEHSLGTIEYGELNLPVIPATTLSADGQLAFFAFQNQGGTRTTSAVAACATNATGCSASSGTAKWISPLLDAVIVAAAPYANGTLVAAISQKETYFLSAVDGHVVNVFNQPITPDGALVTLSAQPGNGTDFYLMNGPATPGSYPTEVIAIDSPQDGELWRVKIEGGTSPSSAMNLAVDDGNNVWLRVGANQVKPLTLSQYRMVKGKNLPPP